MVSDYGVTWRRAPARSPNWTDEALNTHLHDIANQLEAQPIENVHVIFLNQLKEVIADELMWTGTQSQSAIYPVEIIRRAVVERATFIILMHNHPIGDATPSPADVRLTKELQICAQAVGMTLLDHIVVARGGDRHSMHNRGSLSAYAMIPSPALAPEDYAQIAISAITARKSIYPKYAGLFQDQGWTLALALYRENRDLSPKELPLMTHVPYAVILRFLAAFKDARLLEFAQKGDGKKIRSVRLSMIGRKIITDIIIASC
jgi:hypothetical protein